MIVVAICAWKTSRSLIGPALKFILHPRLVTPFLLASAWAGICVWLLYIIRVWKPDNIKTSIVWLGTFAFVTIVDVARAEKTPKKLMPLFWDGFSATAVVLYLAEFETLPLWAEFILLPVGLLIALLASSAERDPELKVVARLFKGLQILLGWGIFAVGLWGAISHFKKFASLNTLRDFGIPILLTGMFLPFLYLLLLYVTFETASRRLGYVEKDSRLRLYAVLRGMWVFRGDLEYFHRFVRDLRMHEGTGLQRIDDTLALTRLVQKRDLAPPIIFWDEGWSPQEAGNFLKEYEIRAIDYHVSYDDSWWASSNHKKLRAKTSLNTMQLHIYGNERAVTRMKLNLAIWDEGKIDILEVVFAKMSQLLIAKALDPGIASQFASACTGLVNFKWEANGVKLSIEYEKVTTVARHTLRIQHPQDHEPEDF